MESSKRYSGSTRERRNAVKVLLRCKVCVLPVDPVKVSRDLGIKVITYREAAGLIAALGLEAFTKDNDGFSLMVRSRPAIFYDDEKTTVERRRFTVAHELGHFINGDLGVFPMYDIEGGEDGGNEESAANRFAAELLAPSCLLRALKVQTAKEIETLCMLSHSAAATRLHNFQRSDSGQLDSFERQLEKQFFGYIRRQS